MRSWFATLSGVAATAFSFAILLIACFLLGAESHLILLVGLVFTHIEAILCLFYLQRISLESLKGKIGVVELEMETTNGVQPQVQQTVRTKAYGPESHISTSGPSSPAENQTGLYSSGGSSDSGTTTGTVQSGADNPR